MFNRKSYQKKKNYRIHSRKKKIILVFSNRVINLKITAKESLVVKKTPLLARNYASSNCNPLYESIKYYSNIFIKYLLMKHEINKHFNKTKPKYYKSLCYYTCVAIGTYYGK